MSNLKIAVIGCGYWGQNLVRKFYEFGALAAICDANTQQAEKIAALYGNVPILSMDEIAASQDIEGVVIASPAILHATHIRKFILAQDYQIHELSSEKLGDCGSIFYYPVTEMKV